jgi:PAS domain-containing protein
MAAGSHSFDDELVGLFELSQDAFCIAGFDGYLKHANPAFPRSLGYTLEQLLALPFAEHIHPMIVSQSRRPCPSSPRATLSSGSSVATSAPTDRFGGSSGAPAADPKQA